MKPPVFVKSLDDPILSALPTVEDAVRWHEAYDADMLVAWDSAGLPLAVEAVDELQVRFVPSGEPPEPETLRKLLAEAMTLSGAMFPKDASLEALQAYALVELRRNGPSVPLRVVAGVLALIPAGLVFVLTR
jgi:hypothetical protein